MSFPKFSNLLNPLITFIILIKNVGAMIQDLYKGSAVFIQQKFLSSEVSMGTFFSFANNYWGLPIFSRTFFQMTFTKTFQTFSGTPKNDCLFNFLYKSSKKLRWPILEMICFQFSYMKLPTTSLLQQSIFSRNIF